jgi:hypothetical protein
VDIAKKFSTHDSGKFVNGILDKVKGDLLRPARAAAGTAQPEVGSRPARGNQKSSRNTGPVA